MKPYETIHIYIIYILYTYIYMVSVLHSQPVIGFACSGQENDPFGRSPSWDAAMASAVCQSETTCELIG